MTQIQCPCCGGERAQETSWAIVDHTHICYDCHALWNEANRRPANVVAWEYMANCLLNSSSGYKRVEISDYDTVVAYTDDIHGICIFDAYDVKIFNWQDMQPVTRDEVE